MGIPMRVIVEVEKKEDDEEGGGEEAAAEEEDGEKKEDNLSDVTEEEEIKIPPKNLTEIDRLAYVVKAIENDC